jgi:NAD(P)-dependent dehydrogenase (short-subunit alcohol dehydrogenase family)
LSSHSGTVLITGAAKRLGLEFAVKCLDMGFDLVLHYRSEKKAAERRLGPRLRARVAFLQADLADPSRDIVLDALSLRGDLIGLINNASAFTPGSISDPHHFHAMLAINAFAPLRLGNSFHAHVKRGWIVNIADAHIRGDNLRFQNYRLSKRLLEDLTRQMALAYAPRIRVNAIAPGAILPSGHRPPGHFRALARSIPLRRTGDLPSLRRALEYLIDNEYVTGQSLFVDGGWHLN